MSTTKNAAIVFLKFPQEGEVKTRLAKDKSEKFATEFYKVCVEHTISEVKEMQESAEIFLFVESNLTEIKEWLGTGINIYEQKGEDLGVKMKNAFEEVFNKGFEHVIIIGTDIPGISSSILKTAFRHLKSTETVIGPAQDGGFYLLGMNQLHEELFKETEWSTDEVLPTLLVKIKSLGCQFVMLPELIDIDHEADIKDWMMSEDVSTEHPVAKFFLDNGYKKD